MSEMRDSTTANRDHNLQDASQTQPGLQQVHGSDAGASNLMQSHQPLVDPVRRRYNLVRITQIIWLVTSVIEALFTIRVLLKLMAANPAAGFAVFIYNMTAVFLAPFFGLTASPSANDSVLELSTLIAMLVYALLAWGIVRVLWIIFERPIVQ
jgi:hypothetical protein